MTTFNGRDTRGTVFGTVSLSFLQKRKAVAKLREVYSIDVTPRIGTDRLAARIAELLKVELPKKRADQARLVAEFIAPNHLAGLDLIVKIKAQYPFVPLRISREMERALARTAEWRELAPSSDGR